MVGQPDKPIALRIATGEQRSARWRAQWRGGMRAGEQDAFGSQLIQARARHVRMTIDAEIATEVVPVHEQHVVAPWVRHLLVRVCTADCGHLLNLSGPSTLSARAYHCCGGGPDGP